MKRTGGGSSFLTRLARDVRGNTIALAAAAMVPLAGLIGGGVDMSRLYLTKTRLQQACDAGALAGRKAMGTGAWNTSVESRANGLFASNFKSGAYGTGTLTKNFSESEGTVSGTATVPVPMTIMRVFGFASRSLTVNCTAKMEIPNTDVMFVLDVTNSMSGTRIVGLKSAVKCFYEALVKVGTAQVCDPDNPSNDPTATTYTGTAQIRLGFVPYAVNVNVGKLLPNAYLADRWSYQSRRRPTTPVIIWAWSPVTGTQVAPSTWSAWSTPTGNLATTNGYNSFAIVSSATVTLTNGNTYAKQATGPTNTATCNALNTMSGGTQILGVMEGNFGTISATSYTGVAPVHPADTQAQTGSRTRQATVSAGYRYRWSSNACWLETATAKTSGNANKYTQTSTGPASQSITWTQYEDYTGGPNTQVEFDVSGLKAGGSSWRDTIDLPVNRTVVKVTPSGSTALTDITLGTTTVRWDGCIEERKTFRNIDGNPSDDWGTIPSDALDLDIDLVPSDSVPNSKWGPMLGGDDVNGTNGAVISSGMNYYCPNPARKLAEYTTSPDLVAYIDSLTVPGRGTYHDIGMIWGARLLSPTGIFASENAMTSGGGAIQRHLIFMTDGKAQTVKANYNAYGLLCIDLRQFQTCPANDTIVDGMVNARLAALCTRIKNMNITLWVISYGGGVSPADETRLGTCATLPTTEHFFSAADGPELIEKFRGIASKIANLRLTS